MESNSLFDVESLLEDLGRMVAYAVRAGVLRNPAVIDSLKSFEASVAAGQKPDIHLLNLAINGVAQDIAPITLADLSFGRDPFTAVNQTRAKRLQLMLSIFALGVLILIGSFMDSLHREKAALLALKETKNEVQQFRPGEKIHALRKMAQWGNPVNGPTASLDQYYQKVDELKQISTRIQSSLQAAAYASEGGFFPGKTLFEKLEAIQLRPTESQAEAVPAGPADEGVGAEPALCSRDAKGQIELPVDAARYPLWMQRIVGDFLSDYCFRIKVLSPGDEADWMAKNVEFDNFISELQKTVSLRADWFLPFFYGLLGSCVFIMRNLASVRTPAMEWFAIIMRVSLGGVAGIVIGWLTSSASPEAATASSATIPLATAFLVGYGIDSLFSVLDRGSRAIGEAAGRT
jgi:hypothetical protein